MAPPGAPATSDVGWTGPPPELARAARRAAALRAEGIRGVAVTMVDNSGVARVKGVPVERLAEAVATGIGAPPVFDAFGADDSIAPSGGPIGDLRLIPDVARVVPLGGAPGWAWAPADRVALDGAAHPGCQRTFARLQQARAAAMGLEVRMAFETEWVLDGGDGDELLAVTSGPAYGMGRLVDVSDYGVDLLEALDLSGIEVQQLHPEYAPSQFECSIAASDAVGAADDVVLLRQVLRAVSRAHGHRLSLSPALTPGGVGSGAHLHASLWAGGTNLLAGPSPDGEHFVAGILDALPGLMAVVAPSVVSYLRLQPSRWAAPWRAWGRENREAALRVVGGSGWTGGAGANVELKVVDASANPYLVVGAVLAAGLDGIERSLPLPPEVTVDPASLSDGERASFRITRLPASLGEALDEWDAAHVVSAAMGPALASAYASVRRAEVERLAGVADEEVARASRWIW